MSSERNSASRHVIERLRILSAGRLPANPVNGYDDYDALCGGVLVGRIMKATASPEGAAWMWTLAYGQHKDRAPTPGCEATREATMAAFARSWRTR